MSVSSRSSSSETVRPRTVARRAGEDDLVGEERLEAHAAVAARSADDPELELARGDSLDDGVRVGHGQVDAHVRVLTLELGERDGIATAAGPVDAPSTRSPASAPPPGGDLRDELVLEGEHPLRSAVQPPACLGRLDAPPRAIEQLRSESLLERAHLE